MFLKLFFFFFLGGGGIGAISWNRSVIKSRFHWKLVRTPIGPINVFD